MTMFLVVTLAAVYIASNIASSAMMPHPHYEKVYYDIDEADNLYKEYLIKHNKRYKIEEHEKRLEIFKQTLKEVNENNKIYPRAVFGPTVFSDLTAEERKSLGCSFPINNTNAITPELDPNAVYEDSLDWRDKGVVTPVKNQGSCGSCYIFGAIGCIEGQHAIKHQECLAFSEQQALDCVQNQGCDGGNAYVIMTELAEDSAALELESDYPYADAKGQCTEDASKKRTTVQGAQQLNTPDEETLKQYLSQYGPLSVSMDAADLLEYTVGIMHPKKCGQVPNHAILLVGYGEEAGTPYWIIKNSWGTDWGEQGYARVQRGVMACGITTNVAVASVA